MKLILLLIAAGVGFQYFGGKQVPEPGAAEVGIIQQLVTVTNAMLSTSSSSLSSAKEARRTVEQAAMQAERSVSRPELGSGLSIPIAAPGCGQPDEHGNLRYCFNN